MAFQCDPVVLPPREMEEFHAGRRSVTLCKAVRKRAILSPFPSLFFFLPLVVQVLFTKILLYQPSGMNQN